MEEAHILSGLRARAVIALLEVVVILGAAGRDPRRSLRSESDSRRSVISLIFACIICQDIGTRLRARCTPHKSTPHALSPMCSCRRSRAGFVHLGLRAALTDLNAAGPGQPLLEPAPE